MQKIKGSFLKRVAELCKIRKGPLFLFALLLCSLLTAVCLIGISLVLQEFVNVATGVSGAKTAQVFILAGGVVLTFAVAMVMSTLLEAGYTNRVEKKLRLQLMGHIADTEQQAADAYHSSDVLTRLTVDTERVINVLPKIFGQLAAEILPCVLALITMLILSWKMALIMLAVVPCIIVILSLISPKQSAVAEKDIANEERNRSHMLEILTHLSLFRVYRMKDKALGEIGTLYDKKAQSKLHLSSLQGITSFLNNFIGFALIFVTMGVGSLFVISGEVTIGTLIAMVQLTNYVLLPLNTLPEWMRKFNETEASVARIDEILALPKYPETAQQNRDDHKISSLVVENVCFRYSADGNQVLRGVSAVFNRGVTCIVGESGSGKSTLLKILLGLYEPEQGCTYGIKENVNLGKCSIEALVSYVPSDKFLFNSTVQNNIIMAQTPDEKRLIQALKWANIQPLISGLDKGVDHEISESGSNLSMGQQQRIAIARALYYNKPILIFDEPTANLDPEATVLFWNTVNAVSAEKIVIIVTHDMALVSQCRQGYLLQEGVLVKREKVKQ